MRTSQSYREGDRQISAQTLLWVIVNLPDRLGASSFHHACTNGLRIRSQRVTAYLPLYEHSAILLGLRPTLFLAFHAGPPRVEMSQQSSRGTLAAILFHTGFFWSSHQILVCRQIHRLQSPFFRLIQHTAYRALRKLRELYCRACNRHLPVIHRQVEISHRLGEICLLNIGFQLLRVSFETVCILQNQIRLINRVIIIFPRSYIRQCQPLARRSVVIQYLSGSGNIATGKLTHSLPQIDLQAGQHSLQLLLVFVIIRIGGCILRLDIDKIRTRSPPKQNCQTKYVNISSHVR